MLTGMQYFVGAALVLVVLRALTRGADLGDWPNQFKHDVKARGGRHPRRRDHD